MQTISILTRIPFRVLHACRCSFFVQLPTGGTAYISNECFLTLMNDPNRTYRVVTVTGPHGTPMDWIEVSVFTRGIKPRRL